MLNEKMIMTTISQLSQLEEIVSESKHLRTEFNGKLYSRQHDGSVTFGNMMEFLSNDDNRVTVEMMIKMSKQLSEL